MPRTPHASPERIVAVLQTVPSARHQAFGAAALADRAFVVLKPFRIPAGLYGAHLANFYVAEGVPLPTGDPGHSTIHDLNTGRCLGAVCRMGC